MNGKRIRRLTHTLSLLERRAKIALEQSERACTETQERAAAMRSEASEQARSASVDPELIQMWDELARTTEAQLPALEKARAERRAEAQRRSTDKKSAERISDRVREASRRAGSAAEQRAMDEWTHQQRRGT